MTTHVINLDRYCASAEGVRGRLVLGTWGSYGIEALQLLLGDGWAGRTVTVVFHGPKTSAGTTVLAGDDGLVPVPQEATANAGYGTLTIVGVDAGSQRISVDVPYVVQSHAPVDGAQPDPTPNQWQQFVAQVKADADRAEREAGDAADSAAAAAKSAEAAGESAQKAEQAGADIGEAKDAALEAIQQAQDTGVQAVQAATTTGVQAVQQAHQAALDDIATDRQQALADIEEAGDKQTAAITSGGAAALEAIGRTEQAAIGQVQQAGTAQVDAVEMAGQAQLDKIAAANALVPTPTQEDAGKSIIVKSDGSGYELGDIVTDAYTKAESDARYAPIEAAIRPTVSGNPATLEHSVAWAMQGLSVYGKSTQVTTTGAQLFDASTASDDTWLIPGSGVVEPARSFWTSDYIQVTNGSTYMIGKKGSSRGAFYDPLKTYVQDVKSGSSNAETWKAPSNGYIRLSGYMNQVPKEDFMLSFGSTALPWQPYTGGKPSPSPDYPQEIVTAGSDGTIDITVSDGADQSQSMTFSTPNGLPGMPVSSGGNYTDSTGKEWICDEVDFDAGVYVQRIGKVSSYSGEYVEGHYMSTTGQLTTGATILYALAAPIETPLSAEELAAYAALRSYNGTTIVSTEAPVAGLSARYVVDGAAYIESKIQSAVTQAVAAAVSLTGGQT